jgi:hypothetical protein
VSGPIANPPGPAADTAGHFRCDRPPCRPGFGHPRTRCRIRRRSAGAVLPKQVARSAAASRMQPAPVGASEPHGQAAAELAADVGHRRAGERLDLLEAEVVDLQPGDLVVLPAAHDRLGACSGSMPTFPQVSWGQARSSQVRSATNTSSPGSGSGSPVSSSYTRRPAGWGTRGCSSAAGSTIRTVPASGSPTGPGGSSRPRQQSTARPGSRTSPSALGRAGPLPASRPAQDGPCGSGYRPEGTLTLILQPHLACEVCFGVLERHHPRPVAGRR